MPGEMRMLAAKTVEPRGIALEEVELPDVEAGWALVRVKACGICGSDLHALRRDAPARAGLCPGHEIAGEVAEVGEGVSDFVPGDRVAVEPLVVCRRCGYCRSGQYQVCPERRLLGTGATSGGLAEYVHVPAYTLFRLPPSLDYALGALAEPLAVGVHALRIAGLQAGDRVAVLGAGSQGLLAVAAARAMGAGDIIISGRHDHQRQAALTLGATRTVGAEADDVRALASESRTKPVDIVVEAVGGEADTPAQAVNLVRAAGSVVLLGLFTRPVSLNATSIVGREVRLTGSIMYGRTAGRADFDVALSILSQHGKSLARLLTHRFHLSEVAQAFETALDKSSGSLKVQVGPFD